MMITSFSSEKVKPSRSRKFPLLPRVGVSVDVFGRRFTYRQASILEAMANLMERGITLSNMRRIAEEQLSEIQFPSLKDPKTITVKAKPR